MGNGTFQGPALYDIPFAPFTSAVGLAIGDFNVAGRGAISVGDAFGHITTFLGSGDGTFSNSATAPSYAGGGVRLAVGDFKGVGSPDLAGLNSEKGVTVFLNKLAGTPNFSVAANLTNLTLHAGQAGTIALTVNPIAGFKWTVSFSCGPLPNQVGCTLSPDVLTGQGSEGTATTTLTITTVGPATGTISTSLHRYHLVSASEASLLWLFSFACVASTVLVQPSTSRRTKVQWLILGLAQFLAVVVLLSSGGCGSTSSSSPPTPTQTGTSAIVAKAVSTSGAAIAHRVLISLTVQP